MAGTERGEITLKGRRTPETTKYYFRKKTRKDFLVENQSKSFESSSSAESEEFFRNLDDSRTLTLHVITDPGQSSAVTDSFQTVIGRLDSTLDLVCVSERFKPMLSEETQQATNTATLPSLAILLFFKREFDIDADHIGNGREDEENLFSKKPWRFHHKVDVAGKLISCDSNQQDFYEFVLSSRSARNIHLKNSKSYENNPTASQVHFPLWGARKVHYGKQILRFTLFIRVENWTDQINFYKLIIRKEEKVVRDDFCFFDVFCNGNTAVQLGLKKLPTSVQSRPLNSSILQFKVKNIGQLVPLLPNACDPISELRWRTRDHDGNVILLQIRRSNDINAGTSFVKRLFSDNDSSISSDSKEKKVRRRRNQATVSNLSTANDNASGSSVSLALDSKAEIVPENRVRNRNTNLNRSDVGDSFVCPSLPDKMPLIEPAVYFQTNSRKSSASSSNTSEYQSARGTSPENLNIGMTSAKENKLEVARIDCKSPVKFGRTTLGLERKSPKDPLMFTLSKDKGFYV